MVNEEIKGTQIRLITEDGNQILDKKHAIEIAEEKGLDLICINSNSDIPVCKIGDYSKYLYEQKKKEKENKKKQKPIETKEIKIGDAIEINDLKTKAKQIDKFLTNGNKVKLSIRYKGRAIRLIAKGPERLQNLMDLLTIGYIIDVPMKTTGNIVSVTIAKK